jgi:hypothetical protein
MEEGQTIWIGTPDWKISQGDNVSISNWTIIDNGSYVSLQDSNNRRLAEGYIASLAPGGASILLTAVPLRIGTSAITAKSGDYIPSWSEITGKPSLQSDWNQTTVTALDYIKNKPMLGTAAAANIADFATAAQGAQIAELNAFKNRTDGFATAAQGLLAETALQAGILTGYATQNWVLAQGYSAGGSGGGGNTAALTSSLNAHIEDHNNPHMVTKAQVGLGNVPNMDATNAANIISGVLSYARIPVGSTTGTIAAGDDPRFATIATKANIIDLGTAAYTNFTAYATAEQGAKADTALQSISVNPTTISGTGTSLNPYDLSVGTKASLSLANTALQGVSAMTGVGNVVTSVTATDGNVVVNKGLTALTPEDITALESRLENIENLGFYLGTADTHTGLPTTVAALQAAWGVNITPTVNDFADVLSDETRANANDSYRIVSVTNGNITWGNAPFRVYGQDVSGFMPKQPTATVNHFAKFNASGEVIDSGTAAADFATATQGAKADTAVQPEALTPLATKVYVEPDFK